jgi:hypothetical protein
MMSMLHEVRDGLWPVQFHGTQLAVSTTERKMPEGRSWRTLTAWEKKAVGRWVEMELYLVDAGQPDPLGRIGLPDGGYLYHVIGQSLIYHTAGSACNAGVPAQAGNTEIDVLPCWNCRPAPPLLWDWPGPDRDPDGKRASLLVPPAMTVDLESPRHTLKRAVTAPDLVRLVIDRQLSTPAQRLLEMAQEQDTRIAEVFSTPAA